jgi:deoxycytidine triphosphate deaminase
MAQLIAGDELHHAVEKGTFIRNGVLTSAEGVKYDFRLSSRFLMASFGRPVDYNDLTESEKGAAVVQPGEVVFVLTEERLELPQNIMAQLSPKRKLSHDGILTLGGFCIDPCYRGRLLVGLFNLSSTPFQLRPGKKLIGATFYLLEKNETALDAPVPEPMEDFPDDLVKVIKDYRPILSQQVLAQLTELQKEVGVIRNAIDSHKQWKEEFENGLRQHNELIGTVTKTLQQETESRVTGQNELSKSLTKVDRTLTWLRGAAWVITGIFGVGVAVLIGWIVHTLSK